MNQVLSQQEIDAQKNNLIDEIIRLSDFSFQQLPMLDIIGERLAENASVALPELTRVLCEASLDKVDYIPMAVVLEGVPKPAFMAICTGEPFDGEIMLTMDATLLMTALELMLGGEAKEDTERTFEGFTEIERGFGEQLSRVFLEELGRSLSVLCPADLDVDTVETDSESVNITQPTSLCVRLQISIAIAGHTGLLEVTIPYDALEPIRPQLGKIHFGERSEGGSSWQEQLSRQIERANLELEAVFTELPISMRHIMNWRPGDEIDLQVEEGHGALLTCAGVPMFEAKLGKRNNGNAAVQITEKLDIQEGAENGRDDN